MEKPNEVTLYMARIEPRLPELAHSEFHVVSDLPPHIVCASLVDTGKLSGEYQLRYQRTVKTFARRSEFGECQLYAIEITNNSGTTCRNWTHYVLSPDASLLSCFVRSNESIVAIALLDAAPTVI